MRINMNIPDELLKQIDEKATSVYMTRTAYIISAVIRQMKQDELLSNADFLKRLRQLEQDKEE